MDHPIMTWNVWETTAEYAAIKKFYGDRCAKRSGLPYMNHIDEGIYILWHIRASEEAVRAWCLHPMIQRDEDLRQNVPLLCEGMTFDPHVMALAFEYRHTANNALATRNIRSSRQIVLSPLKDVNDMLIADKIQNRKDFLDHHASAHPKAAQLDLYFDCWLQALGIDKISYDMACLSITAQSIIRKQGIQY